MRVINFLQKVQKGWRQVCMASHQPRRVSLTKQEAPSLPVFLAREPVLQEADWQYLLQKDQVAAFNWFQKMAKSEQGEKASLALNMMGRAYEHGWGIAVDHFQAFNCYRQAAEQGEIWALFNLADCYRKGVGCSVDKCRATELYAQAAASGHVKSLNMLGLAYEEGDGVRQDLGRAAQYFMQGAQKGDCWACLNHARFLAAYGDEEQSLAWLERSLENQVGDYCQTFVALFASSCEARLCTLVEKAKQIIQTNERLA